MANISDHGGHEAAGRAFLAFTLGAAEGGNLCAIVTK